MFRGYNKHLNDPWKASFTPLEGGFLFALKVFSWGKVVCVQHFYYLCTTKQLADEAVFTTKNLSGLDCDGFCTADATQDHVADTCAGNGGGAQPDLRSLWTYVGRYGSGRQGF